MPETDMRRPRARQRRTSGIQSADMIVSKIALLCASASALIAAASLGGTGALALCVAAYGGVVAGYAAGRWSA